MTKILVFILLLFITIHSYCQDWIRIYGLESEAVGRYIIKDYDKGYDILGMINYYKYSWLVKTDINGNIIWDKRFGNGQFNVGLSNVEKALDGGYIICGTWTKFNNSFDAFLIKLNACADVEWCKTLITPTNYDMGIRIKTTPEGDYILLGAYFDTDPVSNVSLFKFNSTGDLIWHQFYPMDSLYYDDQPQDLLIDDGYLITSSRYSPDSGSTNPKILRSYFIKTDTAGNRIWELVYGTNIHYYSWPWETINDEYGNYYNTCTHIDLTTGDNPALIKINHNGSQSYNHDIITTGSNNFSGMETIKILDDTNFIFTGGWIIDNIKSDVIIKTDTLGNLRKTKLLPLVSNSYVSTAKSIDNKFISIGNDATGATWKIYAVKVNSDLEYDSIYTQPFTYDSLCPYPIVSDTVDPECDNVYVGIDEPFKNPETTKLKIFPNPASDHITIEMPKYLVVSNTTSKIPSTTIYHQWYSTTLEVYDLFGKKMFLKEVIRSETTLNIDVSKWSKGIYLCRLVFNKQMVGDSKVMIER